MKTAHYAVFLTLCLAGCAGTPEPAAPEAPAAVVPIETDSLSAEDLSILLAPDEPEAPAPPVTASNYKAALDSLEAED
ncbi:MAG: hypothetical protein SH809_06940 [Rhodothermales bacterium]|nr:hypothetical protein [Rhodothermales bacterium]